MLAVRAPKAGWAYVTYWPAPEKCAPERREERRGDPAGVGVPNEDIATSGIGVPRSKKRWYPCSSRRLHGEPWRRRLMSWARDRSLGGGSTNPSVVTQDEGVSSGARSDWPEARPPGDIGSAVAAVPLLDLRLRRELPDRARTLSHVFQLGMGVCRPAPDRIRSGPTGRTRTVDQGARWKPLRHGGTEPRTPRSPAIRARFGLPRIRRCFAR